MNVGQVTVESIVLHVKGHLGESTDWDHLSATDVETLVGLTIHSLWEAGALISPDVFERLVATRVANELAIGRAAESTTVHVHGTDFDAEKLDAYFEQHAKRMSERLGVAEPRLAQSDPIPRQTLGSALRDLAVTTWGIVEMVLDRSIARVFEALPDEVRAFFTWPDSCEELVQRLVGALKADIEVYGDGRATAGDEIGSYVDGYDQGCRDALAALVEVIA